MGAEARHGVLDVPVDVAAACSTEQATKACAAGSGAEDSAVGRAETSKPPPAAPRHPGAWVRKHRLALGISVLAVGAVAGIICGIYFGSGW